MRRLRAFAEPLLALLPPLVVTGAWMRWALGVVEVQERAIRPLSGLAYATFVQLAWNFSHGHGWTQTVHRGYADDWRWGGHYTPFFFLSALLSGLGDSPWGLARVQVIAVALGCLPAWLLGWAEARLLGAIAGLLLYAGNAAIAHIALADYQDLSLAIPLFPLAVWAARHGSTGAWVLAAVALGCTREELLVLLPVVGLSGHPRRALWGLGVSLGFFLVYRAMGPPPYPNPLSSILGWQASRGALDPSRFSGIEWGLYGTVAGSGWPWLLFAPLTALAGLPTLLFHHQDPTSVKSIISPAVHHFAPMVGAATAAAIVGIGRLMRIHTGLALLLLGVAAGTTWWSFRVWHEPLLEYGLRVRTLREHPAWALLAKVPADEALLVPESIAPAAAHRVKVTTPDGLGDRVKAHELRWAVDDGRFDGEVVETLSGWRLLRDPELVQGRQEQPTGGRQ